MSLIVKHKVQKHGLEEHWFLRGVSDAGKFYGDIRQHLTRRRSTEDYVRANVQVWQGVLDEDDNSELKTLVSLLARNFDFSAVDLSESKGVRTRIFKGKTGSFPYIQLALIDNYGIAFPEGCGEVVEQLMEILRRYSGPEFRKRIGT